jgi:acyl-CoA thioester hydrolase
MYHATEGWRAATNELLMIHIDYATRRAAPWPQETKSRLERLLRAHEPLCRPHEAGRIIALARPTAPLENP